MFSLACNLTKNDVEFLPLEISSKKVRANNADFSTIKTVLKKVSGNSVDFSTRKIILKKCVETTWSFQPSSLHWKMYVKTTWIFRSGRLHQKTTRKWRGNSSKFSLWRIDVISPWNRRRFDPACPLGYLKHMRGDVLLTVFQGYNSQYLSKWRIGMKCVIWYDTKMVGFYANHTAEKFKNIT